MMHFIPYYFTPDGPSLEDEDTRFSLLSSLVAGAVDEDAWRRVAGIYFGYRQYVQIIFVLSSTERTLVRSDY